MTNKSVILHAMSTLCQLNSSILANENCVFLYFHISSEYTVDDIVKNMDIVYDTCNDESDMAKDFAEVTMISTGVQNDI